MNCVRKHLSRIKGGRLAEAFHGRTLISLILSDVVGDPLDVIASGPTAPDPSTYQDAIAVLERHELQNQVSRAVLELLQSGARGELPETLKVAMPNVQHYILGNNAIALASAELAAARLGYHIINLGSYLEGESAALATVIAGMVRSIREQNIPHAPPVCLLMGGETTVRLDTDSGKGGRNQEFVLALAHTLGEERLRGITILSAGTDGEDGPTDAAGGYLNAELYASARAKKLDPALHLRQHNTYPFLDAVGGLLRTGLTQTNVMDVRIVLIGE